MLVDAVNGSYTVGVSKYVFVVFSLACLPTYADFAGLIQYLKGTATGEDARELKALDLLYAGEEIRLSSKSIIKIITPARCVGVIFGPADIKVPLENEEFNIRSKALRWICPAGKSEVIAYRGSSLQIQGEILAEGKKYLLISGSVGSNFVKKVGIYVDDVLTTKDLEQLHRFNKRWPSPVESTGLPKIKRKLHSRWRIGPVFGGGSFSHGNSEVDRDNLSLSGVRATSNFKLFDQSVLASISWREFENGNENQQNSQPVTGEVFNNSRASMFNLGVAWRYFHESSWSPYFGVGIGGSELKVDYFRQSSGHLRKEIDFVHLEANVGIDKHFLRKTLGWGGLFVSAEFSLAQTLTMIGKKIHEESRDPTIDILNLSGQMRMTQLLLSMGGFLSF